MNSVPLPRPLSRRTVIPHIRAHILATCGARHFSEDNQRLFAAAPGISKRVPKDQRERVVILGSGWAGYVLARRLDTSKFRPLVVSPRSYFVFTPLLNDAAVGTLEFRTTLEPVRKRKSEVDFIQGWADDVNFAEKTVTVEPSVLDPDVGNALTGPRHGNQGLAQSAGRIVPTFDISYDKLIIAVGAYSQTFGTPGVRENALFLKDVGDARKIRRRILELFELAILPTTTDSVRQILLHFAVVGGGPTGMEFAAQLSDLLHDDMSALYPSLMPHVRVSLYDVAPKVLPMFDATLADYAVKKYGRAGIKIKTSHHVEELRRGFPGQKGDPEHDLKGGAYTLRTKEEGDVGIGMCVWSTGNMMNPFVQKALDNVHEYPGSSATVTDGEERYADQKAWLIRRDKRTGAILVDDHLRVMLATKGQDKSAVMNDVFALGDTSRMASGPLPATAQVANQQALWLGKHLNAGSIASETFGFRNLGVMTYLGGAKAMIQGGQTDREGKAKGLKGWLAFLLWRGAYLTMTLSWRNKFLIPIHWFAVKLFGRDITRF